MAYDFFNPTRFVGRDENNGNYLWGGRVNQNSLANFVKSGAGNNATYYDFQDWERKQAEDAQRAKSDAMFSSYMDKAISLADPFKDQRGQYQTQLSELMKNPGSIASSPMFKFAMDQGTEAANRGLAAKGMLNSGNRALELQQVGQGIAGQNFYKMAELLGGLSGSNSNPAAASSALTGLAGLQQNQNQFNQSLALRRPTTTNIGQTNIPGWY